MAYYMIVPLDFTDEQMHVYKILYSEAAFDTMITKYTVEQIVLKSNKCFGLTEQKVRTILKFFQNNNYIVELEKGVKGKPTVCKINKIKELNQQLSNNYLTTIQQLSNSNEQVIAIDTEADQQLSNNYSTAIQQLSNNLFNDKETEKEKKHSVDYDDIFNHYLKAGLINHKKLTVEMKKGIDTAIKTLDCDVEEMKRMIDRHKEKSIAMKDNDKFKVRSLSEFFGQKKWQSVALICSDYSDDMYQSKQSQRKHSDGTTKTKVEIESIPYNPFNGGDN